MTDECGINPNMHFVELWWNGDHYLVTVKEREPSRASKALIEFQVINCVTKDAWTKEVSLSDEIDVNWYVEDVRVFPSNNENRSILIITFRWEEEGSNIITASAGIVACEILHPEHTVRKVFEEDNLGQTGLGVNRYYSTVGFWDIDVGDGEVTLILYERNEHNGMILSVRKFTLTDKGFVPQN
jgi:hypothetical protein